MYDLIFSDKKRLVESVIIPESGGKARVRYLRSNDFLKSGGSDESMTDRNPIVDLIFDIYIDRAENLISGISKQSSTFRDLER